jgi:TP901 family phage tail tape measure protein
VLAAGFGLAAVGGAAAAYELGKFAERSTKAAAVFQQSNTLLTTQAGVARDRIAGLGDAFLTLAPKFATTATALSAAFYHIASAGIPVREQLATLKAAAQGAAIGNANLEDTTNAVVGVLRSGVGGIHGARDAMAQLLAVVGTGNMRLQDLVGAMGTGLPAAAKTFGVSFKSIGAPLAYFSDTSMGAQKGATYLAQAMALIAGPTQQSSKVLGALGLTSDVIKSKFAVVSQMLEKAGITTSQMASDMRKPDGLVVALQDLKTHMDQAGLSANVQAAIITRAFGGGRMGKAVMMIVENLDKIRQKYAQIGASVSGFGAHWQETTQNAVFQAKSLHGARNSISVAIGEAILPAVQRLLAAMVPVISRIADWTTHHKKLAAIILGSAFALGVVTAAVGALGLAVLAFQAAAAPVIAVILGIMAAAAGLTVAAIEIKRHWAEIIDFLRSKWGLLLAAAFPLLGLPMLIAVHWQKLVTVTREVWDDVTTYLVTQWNRIIALAELYWSDFKGWLGTLWGDILADATSAWNNFTSFFGGIWQAIKDGVIDGWNAIKDFFVDIWNGIVSIAHTVWSALGSFFGAIWSGLQIGWTSTWNAIGSALRASWDAIKSAASTVWSALKSFFVAIWDGISSAWNATWNGISSAVEAVWRFTSGSANTIWSALKSFFVAIWGGISSGWTATWNGIHGAVDVVWKDVSGSAHTIWSALKSFFVAIWGGISGGWTATWKGISSALTSAWSGVRSAATTTWKALSSAAGTVWNGLSSMWSSAWSGAWSIVKSFVNKIIDGINALIGAWDSLHFHFGGVNIPYLGKIGAFDVGVPQIAKVPHVGLEEGGIVTSPTLALLGESGPEAVLPLGSGGYGQQSVVIEINQPQFWGPSDVDAFISQFGQRLVTYLLPGAGMQVRRG